MAKNKQEILKKQDLKDLIDKLSDNNKTEGLLLINQLVFIIDTLEKLKDIVIQNGVLEDFKQGKQEFIRESQALKSYNNTMKTYNTTLSNLLKLIDADKIKQTTQQHLRQTSDLDMQAFWEWEDKNRQKNTKNYSLLYGVDITEDNYNDYADYVEKYARDLYNEQYNKSITNEDMIATKLEFYIF